MNQTSEENYDDSLKENANIKSLPKHFKTKPSNDKTSFRFTHHNINDEVFLTFPNTSYIDNEESRLEILAKYNNTKDNLISPIKIIFGEDERTTVLIKNIPESYLPKTLLSELLKNKDLKGKFNFFYLPYKTSSNKNYGFAIVNFTNPLHVITFYEMYNKKYFNKYTTKDKRLDISFININTCKNKQFHDDLCEVQLPLKYLDIFKKVNRKAVCVVKEVNIYNEGMFVVKKNKKNK